MAGDLEAIIGGVHCDQRGTLRFCNDFDMLEIRRLYTISNSDELPVRGWKAHKKETKWFFPIHGTTVIGIEVLDAEKTNSRKEKRFLLNAEHPWVLKVPPGHWFYIEQHDGAEVMVFSNYPIGECENDELRRPL